MRSENEPQGNTEWLQEFNLALEDRVPCDSEDCPNDAIYFTRVGCCNAVLLACRGCMINAGKVVQHMVMRRKAITCSGCGKQCNPMNWMSQPQKLALDTSS